ncbi:pyridoxamine 5'-phosphate oxidase [Atractiella rhizophila]|nr:pyridoxamine 5'-phosphate oxidase [Atractiella rhizophila]
MPPPPKHVFTSPDYVPDPTLQVTLSALSPSPLVQFSTWLEIARNDPRVPEPGNFVLSTSTPSGVPSSRVVLLRHVDDRGFVFLSNYSSRKGMEIESNEGWVAMNFFWYDQNRQVRVVGKVEKVSREESERYFNSRTLDSKVGAWAGRQSEVVPGGGREWLDEQVAQAEAKFAIKEGNTDIPVPDFWGGYRVLPTEVEFWVGQSNRLHDRFRYLKAEGKEEWEIERLSP